MVVRILICSGRSSQKGDAELNESVQLGIGYCRQVSWNRDCRHWLTYDVDVKKKVVARLTMMVGQRSCTVRQDVNECEVALRQAKRMEESERE